MLRGVDGRVSASDEGPGEGEADMVVVGVDRV